MTEREKRQKILNLKKKKGGKSFIFNHIKKERVISVAKARKLLGDRRSGGEKKNGKKKGSFRCKRERGERKKYLQVETEIVISVSKKTRRHVSHMSWKLGWGGGGGGGLH